MLACVTGGKHVQLPLDCYSIPHLLQLTTTKIASFSGENTGFHEFHFFYDVQNF